MIVFHFTKQALREFESFDPNIRNMLSESLISLKDNERLKASSKRVINLLPATERLRIGNYRFLYKREGDDVIFLKIGHRRDIYK